MAITITPATPTQIVLRLASKNQSELQKVSIQISSGNKHTDFKGFAEEASTENFLLFKASMKDTETYIRANNNAITRLKTMDKAIEEIQDMASELAVLITQRRNSASGEDIPVTIQTESMLDKIAGKLNVQFDGRFLFAGSKTDTKPVINIHHDNLDALNNATAIYYQGDNDKPTVRSNDSEEVEYGVLANDDSFKNLIGAAHLAINGHEQDSDTLLAAAMDMVNNSIQQMTSARADVRASIEIIEKTNASHDDFRLLIQANLDDVTQTDIVQATAKMNELEAIVQASYLAFTRLSNLNLVNYLQ